MCAAVLPTADPLHKVTIIPSGMALGVTMQLPTEERHIYRQDYIEDSLVVRMGGRIAEELVFGVVSTGANNDLVGATELARKMVREWGMSTRVGPMAWGSQGQVFLGEDLMHTRDYSDDTARVIDEEVERILREAQERCRTVLTENRNGLDLVARALLEHETIDGTEVDPAPGAGPGRLDLGQPPQRGRRQRPADGGDATVYGGGNQPPPHRSAARGLTACGRSGARGASPLRPQVGLGSRAGRRRGPWQPWGSSPAPGPRPPPPTGRWRSPAR